MLLASALREPERHKEEWSWAGCSLSYGKNQQSMDFLGVLVVKNAPLNAGDTGSSLVWERLLMLQGSSACVPQL